MLSPEGGPTHSQPSRHMSSGHHISMEYRLRKKHLSLNSDTGAGCETYLKEIQEKRKRRTHVLRKKKET